MTTIVESLLDTGLYASPQVGEATPEELMLALDNITNAIQILTNEVERIRIATGTSAP